MDIYSSSVYPANTLSNLAPNSFILDDVVCQSMEGFLQSLKFESVEKQIKICKLFGLRAKSKGSKKKWYKDQKLYWQNKTYYRSSEEYQLLLDSAFLALSNNKEFRIALLSTGTTELTHLVGLTNPCLTVLTSDEFCSRLINLRKHLK